jgi:23S rRNA pseudouridine2605 synthase
MNSVLSTESPQTEKLQKVLARAGLGSRREIEIWIQEGRVHVNRQIATIGDRVNLKDELRVDGRKISWSALQIPPRRVLCYHKPAGEVCSRHDPEGRTTVFERLPSTKRGRWINIGRLDFNTAGLLLFTTDGELAYRLMHPSYNIEREYAVRILGEVDKEILKRLQEGVQLDDGMAHFNKIVYAGGNGANHWYHVSLNEGRNHEVRRLWESQGVTVSRLIRIRFGPISLPRQLWAGHYIELNRENRFTLLKLVGLNTPSPTLTSDSQFKSKKRFVPKHRKR